MVLPRVLLFGITRDVNGVENEVAKRAHLEARYVLAHRHVLSGVVEGCPRSLVLEDDLRLLIELRTFSNVARLLCLGQRSENPCCTRKRGLHRPAEPKRKTAER